MESSDFGDTPRPQHRRRGRTPVNTAHAGVTPLPPAAPPYLAQVHPPTPGQPTPSLASCGLYRYFDFLKFFISYIFFSGVNGVRRGRSVSLLVKSLHVRSYTAIGPH